MKGFTKGLVLALTVALILPLAARAADAKKLIEKQDPNKGPQTDQQFLAKAIAADVGEIKFAEHALKHADNKDVQRFAQKMIDDHTKNRDKLLQVAKVMKVGVVEGLGKGHRDEMARLMKFKGADFDREYMQHMIKAHEKVLHMYEILLDEGQQQRAAGNRREGRPRDQGTPPHGARNPGQAESLSGLSPA